MNLYIVSVLTFFHKTYGDLSHLPVEVWQENVAAVKVYKNLKIKNVQPPIKIINELV